MITIQDARQKYHHAFKTISDTAHLDIDVLLSYVTGLTRAALFAHPEKTLSLQMTSQLEQLVQRRLAGEPIAYLVGHKEFWGLDLKVTPDVLIPRPETECLVEWILAHYQNIPLNVADLGVGSGAIALALAKERPHWQIHATDHSKAAINIAKHNATQFHLNNIHFFYGEWCQALPDNRYDIMVSNPPYIDSNDPHLIKLTFEPKAALDGGSAGLEAISTIIEQATHYLKPLGLLIIEHGYDQRKATHVLLKEAGYINVTDHNDLASLPRFTTAKYDHSGPNS